jgi:hypothetical protein
MLVTEQAEKLGAQQAEVTKRDTIIAVLCVQLELLRQR